MDPRQRVYDPQESFRAAVDAILAGLWTSLPCAVVAVNIEERTISAVPTIIARMPTADGNFIPLPMPVLTDVPILWQGGGGVTGFFPVNIGDEALVLFSARCIDSWWASGATTLADDQRMHDLSDGFALVGVRSLPRVTPVPAGVAGLVSDDGLTVFSLNPTSKSISVTAQGGINLNGVTIDTNGNITAPAQITATGNITSEATVIGKTDVLSGSTNISGANHEHTASGSPTSAPIPGT